MPFLIGLTGGIGCGKSTVARFFNEMGFETLDTDLIARHFLENGPDVQSALRERFGAAVFDGKGRPDRKALARRVFSDEAARRFLESLLHPLVREEWESRAASSTAPAVAVEIPLLFEKKLEKRFDIVVCVSARQSIQLSRLEAKGATREQALARIRSQLPLEEKTRLADHVISNNGTLQFAESQARLMAERHGLKADS